MGIISYGMPPTFSICFLLADIFKHGIWSELESITDPELKVLAEFLPVAALQSRSPSTAKKYAGTFCHWRKGAATKPGVVSFPAKPIHVGLYLSFLIQKAKTPSPVEEAVNALSWAHNLACVEDPTGHPLVNRYWRGPNAYPPIKLTRTLQNIPIEAGTFTVIYG